MKRSGQKTSFASKNSSTFPNKPVVKDGPTFSIDGQGAVKFYHILQANPSYVHKDELTQPALVRDRLRRDFPEVFNKYSKASLRNGLSRLMKKEYIKNLVSVDSVCATIGKTFLL